MARCGLGPGRLIRRWSLPSGRCRNAYVGDEDGVSVSVIDAQTNQVVRSSIGVEGEPAGIAITPDGKHAYVADFDQESVSVIDTQTNQVVGSPIKVGELRAEIAVTPDGRYAYVTNQSSETVSVIDTQTNPVVGPPDPGRRAESTGSRSPPTESTPTWPASTRKACR